MLERQVVHWDTAYLAGQIRNLIAALHYQGHVSVTFPAQYGRVVIQSPSQGGFKGFLAVFTRPHRYEVIKAVWPYARTVSPDNTGEGSSRAGGAVGAAGSGAEQRECAVVGEAQWWREWRPAIERAVLEGRKGWVSQDDRLEAAILGDAVPPKVCRAFTDELGRALPRSN